MKVNELLTLLQTMDPDSAVLFNTQNKIIELEESNINETIIPSSEFVKNPIKRVWISIDI